MWLMILCSGSLTMGLLFSPFTNRLSLCCAVQLYMLLCFNSFIFQHNKVSDLAARGIRCLSVARTGKKSIPKSMANDTGDDEVLNTWEYVGLITFLDPPRPDTKETIERANAYGVDVKMITGDQVAIAKEMCRIIGLGSNILLADNLPQVLYLTC